ncbi:MAG: SCO family protein [Steroidobacteraceae bacterium]
MSSRYFWVLVGLVCLGASFAGYRLAAVRYSRPSVPDYGTWLPQPRPLGRFALTDSRGRSFNQNDLAGHLTLMYFGYTRCADECPDTLALLARVAHRVARVPLQVLFVSVDPRHDSPAVLAAYLDRFNRSFIGLTGAPRQVRRLSARLGVARGKLALPGGGTTFAHTVALFLLDGRGREVAVFTAPFSARRLAAVLRSGAERLLVLG